MKKSMIALIIVAAGSTSCRQHGTSTLEPTNNDMLDTAENAPEQRSLIGHDEEHIYTRYTYVDPRGGSFIIQNSYPKGGMRYTDPTGQTFVYAVFWTELVNQTAETCEWTVDFSGEPAELPSSPGIYFRLLSPPDTMTVGKYALYDYGLTDLKPFLDRDLGKASSLHRTIPPKGSTAFYVVALSNKGVNGTTRSEFTLEDQGIVYSINKDDIRCGKISLKDLTLRK